ncbi:MAG: hypothetical protein V7K89_29985 [Nostoc sp.]|uniref:hypothetical protein n=1 Tax=Nostoc sp. TaxID=1180 RepID=UPI002FFC79CD
MKEPFTPRFSLDLRCNFHTLLIEFARIPDQYHPPQRQSVNHPLDVPTSQGDRITTTQPTI